MRRARFKISPETLKTILDLPDEAHIVDIRSRRATDTDRLDVYIAVEDPSLPESDIAHAAHPTWTKRRSPEYIRFDGWGVVE